ncbi:amidohydrolase [Anaerolentibacter hominis]|uniref:amidohydrolase n=1 Tax=Anaerolentibacter hominis TaxID=3079009 RepID=UPI0031B8285D
MMRRQRKKKKVLYTDGIFHTMRTEDESYEYLGVKGENICYLGNTRPEGDWEEVSLHGRHVFPAMIDSHLHLTYSLVLAASSFVICTVEDGKVIPSNLEGVRAKICGESSKYGKNEIIVANNYIVSAMEEKRLPTRQELDEWTGGRAMVLYNIDGHSSSLSTRMLERLGIDPAATDGILSGKEHEFNQGKITGLIAKSVTPAKLARGIGNFTNLCCRYGISHVCALDGSGDVKKDTLTRLMVWLFRRMDIGVRFFPQYMDFPRTEYFRRFQKRPRVGGCGVWEMDGSVGSHSAAFYRPYRDNGARGDCYYPTEQIEDLVKAAYDRGYVVTAHAIGEKAIDQITGIMEKLPRRLDAGKGMNRIDHFEFPTEGAVDKICRMDVAVTVQPGFSWMDRHYLKSYEQFLEQEIIDRQVPLKRLVKAGVCVCGSSDSPVQGINPFEQMLGMVDFYVPSQSLSPYEALCTYTKNGARMLGEDGEIGTLEVGKLANFFTMKENILKTDKNRIGGLLPEAMYVQGRLCREKKGTLGELIGMLFRRSRAI